MQSKLDSLVESGVNVGSGFLIALVTQVIIFPWFGIQVDFATNMKITAIFTLVSIARGYLIRRWFNRRLMKRIRRDR